jgi:toxin ParE1/3/4
MVSNDNFDRIYKLSEFADSDLEDIYEYSFAEFGFMQAEDYLEGVHNLFEQLTLFPNEGILRKDIAENIRSIPYQSHIVFYLIYEKSILIIRILHQSQNAQDYF